MSTEMGKAICPNCGREVFISSRVLDTIGEKIQPIIPAHYTCPARDHGSVMYRKINRKKPSEELLSL